MADDSQGMEDINYNVGAGFNSEGYSLLDPMSKPIAEDGRGNIIATGGNPSHYTAPLIVGSGAPIARATTLLATEKGISGTEVVLIGAGVLAFIVIIAILVRK